MLTNQQSRSRNRGYVVLVSALTLSACSGRAEPDAAVSDTAPARTSGTAFRVVDTTVTATFEASGVAEPLQQATLSTRLMGTVTAVLVHEGDIVRAEQPVLRLDARDLSAKAAQVAASIADAEALQADAARHAARFRALYADSAATRAQYDGAETGLARADAGLRSARAAARELDALSSYATVRAPFGGVITARYADPGMLAAPGAPLLQVQDVTALRVRASVGADEVRSIVRGRTLAVTIDGEPATAVVEGVVSASAPNLFTVNAVVMNRSAHFRAGSAAVLHLPVGIRHALFVPLQAIVREGDLTGVIVRGAQRDERRWVRLGAQSGAYVDVTSGLTAGEDVVVPSAVSSDVRRTQ